MTDTRHPIVVGVGQVMLRDQAWPDIAGPMELMAEATSRAEADAGGSVLSQVDQVTVVHMFCWDYRNAPALLAETLGLDPRAEHRYLEIGGNTPQTAVNGLAARLTSGEIDMALVAGGEVLAAKLRARRGGKRVDWGTHPEPLPPDPGREPNHPAEQALQAELPMISYPLWEPALRSVAGRSPTEHVEYLGRLMARFTEVAADNPYAWFPKRQTPDELTTVSSDNRMVCTPYTKRLNSIIRVDQGAALLLTTVGKAQELGIPEDKWVYILGGGDCHDIWYLTERTTYERSPGMRKAADQTWTSSGLGIDEVDHVDLYSCFPSAVQLAMEAYGIAPDDPRPMTVTGGLAYAGGPGNNYTTHSIATMTEKLRENPGDIGLCTGLGWHVTKHAAGLYSSGPPAKPYERVDPSADQAAIGSVPHPVIEPEPSGTATIEGYSVSYSRDGTPEVARCLARLDVDHRSLVSSNDPDVAGALAEGEWYGREIEVTPDAAFSV